MALSPQQFSLKEGALTFKVRVWGVSKEPKFLGLGEFSQFPPLETAVALEVSRVGVLWGWGGGGSLFRSTNQHIESSVLAGGKPAGSAGWAPFLGEEDQGQQQGASDTRTCRNSLAKPKRVQCLQTKRCQHFSSESSPLHRVLGLCKHVLHFQKTKDLRPGLARWLK